MKHNCFNTCKDNITMQFFVAFVALAIVGAQAATLSEEQRQKLVGYHKECQTKSGVDQVSIDDAKAGKYRDDPKAKAHLYCVSQKIGFQNSAGEIQRDVIIQKLTGILGNKDLAASLTDKCAKVESSPEQTAYSALKCYYENTPDHISLV